jgi:ubiquitin-activating enzyme E1
MAVSIDSDLQSRQLATYGVSVMERLAGASILIIGMNGVGVEVAKNIVLANVRRVTLADDRIAAWSDMGTHFYLQPDDVGRTNRAEACLRGIKDVNAAVEVVCFTDAISEDVLAAHDAVCVCDCVCTGGQPGAVSLTWNDICRSRGVSFIRCEARGAFGYVFDDFVSSGQPTSVGSGARTFSTPNHGETIAHISNSSPAVVTIDRPNCGDLVGQTVRFSGVQGMPQLNDACAVVAAQQRVKLFENESQLLVTLKDVDTTSMGAYQRGGTMTAAPFDSVYAFSSLRDAWCSDAVAACWPLVGNHGQTQHPRGQQHITRMLHVAFRTLENSPGRKLTPGNAAEAGALVDDICREIERLAPEGFFFPEELEHADSRAAAVLGMRPFFATFAMSCAGSLSPVTACVGGIAAQELIKCVARMAEPLSQFLFLSFVDILPKPLPTFAEVAPSNCRYDSHVAVLGAPFHSQLRALKVHYGGAWHSTLQL